ncbi:MAG: hypothetical protein D6820_18760 [Lentisphaerae bacterium]|nr:MAG: hypothetical protein D6820_18760 [Lentisphaerota bacterium]
MADPFPGMSRRTGLPPALFTHLWIGKATIRSRDGFLIFDSIPLPTLQCPTLDWFALPSCDMIVKTVRLDDGRYA